jgi:methyltransferase-like protein
MRLTLAGLIQLNSSSGPYTHKKMQTPRATKLAQYQAKKKNLVTNQRHELVALNIVESKLLAYCDGTKNVNKILEKMHEHFMKGELKLIKDTGEEITQQEEIHTQAELLCRELLKKMANNALFVTAE